MIIKTWRDPYKEGFSPTKPKEIELHPGLTVLVGCNGAGKSTLLHNIKEHCSNNNIPCNLYDNLRCGGSNSVEELLYAGNYEEGIYLLSASEGECIKENLGRDSTSYKGFFESGMINSRKNRLAMLFSDNRDEQTAQLKNCRDRVLLFDAVDSGLSVDSIIEVKAMFKAIMEDAQKYDVDIYIVIAANEYELAKGENCFDVNAGKYVRFMDYENYRSFIIRSRAAKEKRIERQKEWRKKQHDKNIEKYKNLLGEYDRKYKDFIQKVQNPENLSFGERHKLDLLKRPVEDFEREIRFVSKEELKAIRDAYT